MAGTAELNVVVNLISKFKDGIPGLSKDAGQVTKSIEEMLKVPATAGKSLADAFDFDGKTITEKIGMVQDAIRYLQQQLADVDIAKQLSQQGVDVGKVAASLKGLGTETIAALEPAATRIVDLTERLGSLREAVAEAAAGLKEMRSRSGAEAVPADQLATVSKNLRELRKEYKATETELSALRKAGTAEERTAIMERMQAAREEAAVRTKLAKETADAEADAATSGTSAKKKAAQAGVADAAKIAQATVKEYYLAAEEEQRVTIAVLEAISKARAQGVSEWKAMVAQIEPILAGLQQKIQEANKIKGPFGGASDEMRAQAAQLEAMLNAYKALIDKGAVEVEKGVEKETAARKRGKQAAVDTAKAQEAEVTAAQAAGSAARIAAIEKEISALQQQISAAITKREGLQKYSAERDTIKQQIQEWKKQIRDLTKEYETLASGQETAAKRGAEGATAAIRAGGDAEISAARSTAGEIEKIEDSKGSAVQALAEKWAARKKTVFDGEEGSAKLNAQEALKIHEQQKAAELQASEEAAAAEVRLADKAADGVADAGRRAADARIEQEQRAARTTSADTRAADAAKTAEIILDIERRLSAEIEQIRINIARADEGAIQNRLRRIQDAAQFTILTEEEIVQRIRQIWSEVASEVSKLIPDSSKREVVITFKGALSPPVPLTQAVAKATALIESLPKEHQVILVFKGGDTIRRTIADLKIQIADLQRASERDTLSSGLVGIVRRGAEEALAAVNKLRVEVETLRTVGANVGVNQTSLQAYATIATQLEVAAGSAQTLVAALSKSSTTSIKGLATEVQTLATALETTYRESASISAVVTEAVKTGVDQQTTAVRAGAEAQASAVKAGADAEVTAVKQSVDQQTAARAELDEQIARHQARLAELRKEIQSLRPATTEFLVYANGQFKTFGTNAKAAFDAIKSGGKVLAQEAQSVDLGKLYSAGLYQADRAAQTVSANAIARLNTLRQESVGVQKSLDALTEKKRKVVVDINARGSSEAPITDKFREIETKFNAMIAEMNNAQVTFDMTKARAVIAEIKPLLASLATQVETAKLNINGAKTIEELDKATAEMRGLDAALKAGIEAASQLGNAIGKISERGVSSMDKAKLQWSYGDEVTAATKASKEIEATLKSTEAARIAMAEKTAKARVQAEEDALASIKIVYTEEEKAFERAKLAEIQAQRAATAQKLKIVADEYNAQVRLFNSANGKLQQAANPQWAYAQKKAFADTRVEIEGLKKSLTELTEKERHQFKIVAMMEASPVKPFSQGIIEITEKLRGLPKSQEFVVQFENFKTLVGQLEQLEASLAALAAKEKALLSAGATAATPSQSLAIQQQLVVVEEAIAKEKALYESLIPVAEKAFATISASAKAYAQEDVAAREKADAEIRKSIIANAIEAGEQSLVNTSAAVNRRLAIEQEAYTKLLDARKKYNSAVGDMAMAEEKLWGAMMSGKGISDAFKQYEAAKAKVAELKTALVDAGKVYSDSVKTRRQALAEQEAAETAYLQGVQHRTQEEVRLEEDKNDQIEAAWRQHSRDMRVIADEGSAGMEAIARRQAEDAVRAQEEISKGFATIEKNRTKTVEQEGRARVAAEEKTALEIEQVESEKNRQIEAAWKQHQRTMQDDASDGAAGMAAIAKKQAAEAQEIQEETAKGFAAIEKEKVAAAKAAAAEREAVNAKTNAEIAENDKETARQSLAEAKKYAQQQKDAIVEGLVQARQAAAVAGQAVQEALASGSKQGVKDTAAAAAAIKTEIAKIADANRAAGRAVREGSKADADAAADAYKAAVARIKEQLAGIGRSWDDLNKPAVNATKTWEDRMNGMSYRFTHVAFQLGIAGAAAMEAFKKPIEAAKDLAKEIEYTAGITGEGEVAFKKLKAAALEIGGTTIYGPQKVAEGMRALVQAGLDTEQAIGAVKPVLDFASAGMISLDDASRSAISTMNQFGLSLDQLPAATNLIQAAANRTNAEVKDFNEALKNVGPTARSVGASLGDTTAALGLLAQAGIKGSAAGTQLRGIYRKLLEASDAGSRAGKVFSQLGISVTDAGGQFKDMAVLLEEVRTKTADMSDVQRAATIYQIFGQRAGGPAMIAMLNAGAGAIDALKKKYAESADAASIARERSEGLWGSLEKLKNAWTSLIASIGFTPGSFLKSLVQGLTDATNAVTALIEKHPMLQKMISGFLAFAGIAGSLALVGGAFAMLMGNITSVLGVMGPLQRMFVTLKLTMSGIPYEVAKAAASMEGLAASEKLAAEGAATLQFSLKGMLGVVGRLAAILYAFNGVTEVWSMAKNNRDTAKLINETNDLITKGQIKNVDKVRATLVKLEEVKERLRTQKAVSALSFGLAGDTEKLQEEYDKLTTEVKRLTGKGVDVELEAKLDTEGMKNQAKKGAQVIVTELDHLFGNAKLGIDKFDLSKVIDAIDKTDGILATIQDTADLTKRRLGNAFDTKPVDNFNSALNDVETVAQRYAQAYEQLGMKVDEQTAREIARTEEVKAKKIQAVEEYFSRAMDATDDYITEEGKIDEKIFADRQNAYEMTLQALDKMYEDALKKMEDYAADVLKAEKKLAQDRIDVEVWANEQMTVSDKLKSDAQKTREHLDNMKKVWAEYVTSRDAGDYESARKNLEAYKKLVEKAAADSKDVYADAWKTRDELETKIAEKKKAIMDAERAEAKKDSATATKYAESRVKNADEIKDAEAKIAEIRKKLKDGGDEEERARWTEQISELEEKIAGYRKQDTRQVDTSDPQKLSNLKEELSTYEKQYEKAKAITDMQTPLAEASAKVHAESKKQLSVQEETQLATQREKETLDGINNVKQETINLDELEIQKLQAKQAYYIAYLSDIAVLSEGIRQIWVEINKNGLGMPAATEGAKQLENLKDRFKAITGKDVEIKVVTMPDGTTRQVIELNGKQFNVGVVGQPNQPMQQVLDQTKPGAAPSKMPVQTTTTVDAQGQRVLSATGPTAPPQKLPIQTQTVIDANGQKVLQVVGSPQTVKIKTDLDTAGLEKLQGELIEKKVKFRIGADDKRIMDVLSEDALKQQPAIVQRIAMKLHLSGDNLKDVSPEDMMDLVAESKKGNKFAEMLLKIDPKITTTGQTLLQYAREVMANEMTAKLPIDVRVQGEDPEVVRELITKDQVIKQIGLKAVANDRDIQLLKESAAMGDKAAEYMLRINPQVTGKEGETLIQRAWALRAEEKTAQLPVMLIADAQTRATLEQTQALKDGTAGQVKVTAVGGDSQTSALLAALNQARATGSLGLKTAMQLLPGKDTETIVKILGQAGIKTEIPVGVTMTAEDKATVDKTAALVATPQQRVDLAITASGDATSEIGKLLDGIRAIEQQGIKTDKMQSDLAIMKSKLAELRRSALDEVGKINSTVADTKILPRFDESKFNEQAEKIKRTGLDMVETLKKRIEQDRMELKVSTNAGETLRLLYDIKYAEGQIAEVARKTKSELDSVDASRKAAAERYIKLQRDIMDQQAKISALKPADSNVTYRVQVEGEKDLRDVALRLTEIPKLTQAASAVGLNFNLDPARDAVNKFPAVVQDMLVSIRQTGTSESAMLGRDFGRGVITGFKETSNAIVVEYGKPIKTWEEAVDLSWKNFSDNIEKYSKEIGANAGAAAKDAATSAVKNATDAVKSDADQAGKKFGEGLLGGAEAEIRNAPDPTSGITVSTAPAEQKGREFGKGLLGGAEAEIRNAPDPLAGYEIRAAEDGDKAGKGFWQKFLDVFSGPTTQEMYSRASEVGTQTGQKMGEALGNAVTQTASPLLASNPPVIMTEASAQEQGTKAGTSFFQMLVSTFTNSSTAEIDSKATSIGQQAGTKMGQALGTNAGDGLQDKLTPALQEAGQQIDQWAKSQHPVITVKVVTDKSGANATGGGRWGGLVGVAKGFAQGGHIPGYGGGDKIPAMLEAGEYVLPKEAVRGIGVSTLNAIRQLFVKGMGMPSFTMGVPAFAAGGVVTASSAKQQVDVNLNLGGDSYKLTGEKDVVTQLMEKLRREERTMRRGSVR